MQLSRFPLPSACRRVHHDSVPVIPSPPTPVAAASAVILGAFREDSLQPRVAEMRAALGGPADVVLAFVTPHWLPHFGDFLEVVQIGMRCRRVAGCTAGGLVSAAGEHEEMAGCSLLAVRAAGSAPRLERWPAAASAWPSRSGPSNGAIILGHPLHLAIDGWMECWRHLYPSLPAFGGLASGGTHASAIKLFDEDGLFDGALLAVHFTGQVHVGGAVAQSYRPLGFPYVVTGAEGNILTSLGGQPPMRRLEEAFRQYQKAGGAGGPLAPGLVHAGFPASENEARAGHDEFVVRAIIGADSSSGSMALAGLPRVGQTLQFQLRDPGSADEAWGRACRRLKDRLPSPSVAALLFPCLGRGHGFFGRSGHDSGVLTGELGAMPMAGAFVNGELALTGDRMHAHTFSVAAAVLRGPAP